MTALDRSTLPDAPPESVREAMVGAFEVSKDYSAGPMSKAIKKAIAEGYLVFTAPDVCRLTKEGYDEVDRRRAEAR
jgi:hypothetical protein